MRREIKEMPVSSEQPKMEPSPETLASPELEGEKLKTGESGKAVPSPKVRKEPTTSTSVPVSGLVGEKSETLKEIEKILSEGLEKVYQNLPDNLRQEFKEKGEETASKIELIIERAKVVVYKIIVLIREWLMIVPGVNRFFLEKEIKIKTDRIMALAEKKKKID